MAYTFGDGFDCYALRDDSIAGYWDSGAVSNFTLTAGRFTGSQAINFGTSGPNSLVKSSGSNDAVHHIVLAYRQTAALSGSTLGLYFQFVDGTTNQCCVVFRSDGAILLTSATPGGTVLDTYTGAVTAQNTWFAFEFEVVINNATGSWAVRKNGNTSNDRALGGLNTRPGTNPYANKLQIGLNGVVNATQIDDILWRSDSVANGVPWVGDVRCYSRLPVSDVSAQFSRAPTTNTFSPNATGTLTGIIANTARYTPFTSPNDGTISSVTLGIQAASTANIKCAIFASSGGVPTTVLGTANVLSAPPLGYNVVTFPTPVTVVKNGAYFIATDADTTSGNFNCLTTANTAFSSATTYAAFPVANPVTTLNQQASGWNITINITVNANMVCETLQDGTTTYVYDSNVGDADFYTIGALAGTPASTVAVITRGFFEKSDAGTRGAAVQLKSGATTVQSTPTLLSTSWGWLYRVDTVDPATGSAWTAAAVSNVTIGPVVTS